MTEERERKDGRSEGTFREAASSKAGSIALIEQVLEAEYRRGYDDARREMARQLGLLTSTEDTSGKQDGRGSAARGYVEATPVSARHIIMELLGAANGPVPIPDVKAAVVHAGLKESTFAKMRDRLRREGLIDSDKRSYRLTDMGRAWVARSATTAEVDAQPS